MFSKPPAQQRTEQRLRGELEKRLEAHSRTQANEGMDSWEGGLDTTSDMFVSVGPVEIGYINEITHDEIQSRLCVGHFRITKDQVGKGFGAAMLNGLGRVAKKRLKCTEIIILSKGEHEELMDKFMSGKGAQLLPPSGNNGKRWLWIIP